MAQKATSAQSNGSPVVTQEPTDLGAPITPAKDQKKSGKVWWLTLLACVIAGGGAAAGWYFYDQAQNTPEKVALDAFSSLLEADHLVVEAQVSYTYADGNDELSFNFQTNSRSEMDFPSSSDRKNLSFRASGEVAQEYPDLANLSLQIEHAIDRDGVIYIRTENLYEPVRAFAQVMVGGLLSAFGGDSDGQQLIAMLDEFQPFVESFDETWWQIDPQAVLTAVKQNYPDYWSQDRQLAHQQLADAYQCVWRKFGETSLDELAQKYRLAPFVTLDLAQSPPFTADEGAKIYTLKLDAQQFANFWNSLGETTLWTGTHGCLAAQLGEDVDFPRFESSDVADLEEALASQSAPPVYVEVTQRGHRVTRVYMAYTPLEFGSALSKTSDDWKFAIRAPEPEELNMIGMPATPSSQPDVQLVFDAKLTYPTTSTVQIPTTSTPVWQAVERVQQLAKEIEAITTGEPVEYQYLDPQAEIWQELAASAQRRLGNIKRLEDMQAAAKAMETCYDVLAGQYEITADGTYYVSDWENVSGPFSALANSCLNSDIVPEDPDYPYYYTIVNGGRSFAVCALLEGAEDATMGNSFTYLTAADYEADTNRWPHVTWRNNVCVANMPCYYCQTGAQ